MICDAKSSRALRLLGSTGLAALALACSAGPAFAQTTDAAADTGLGANDIVVTSRRTAERLQDVPLSINALSADDLAKRGSTDLQDVANYTPGLRFTDFLSKFNGNAVIRGLAQTNVQDAIGNTGVFVDGIYLQRGYMVDSQLADVERIEIVKGPQSALYGQNTFSGAINYVLRAPTDELHANGQVSAGNGGYKDVRVGIGGPIVPGLLSARVYYATSDFNGVWKNNWPGAQSTDLAHYGGYKRENFSAYAKLTPTAGLTITGSYYRLERTEKIRAFYTIDGNLKEDKLTCGALAANGSPSLWCGNLPTSPADKHTGLNAANIPNGLFTVPQPGMHGKTEVYHGAIEYKFADDFTFNYDYGNVRGEGLEQSIFTSNSYYLTPASYKQTVASSAVSLQREAGVLKYQSHDARLGYDHGGPFKMDFGYFHSRAADSFIFGLNSIPVNGYLPVITGNTTDVTAYNVVGGATPLPGFIAFTNKYTVYTTDSAYARGSYTLLDDAMTLAAEARYTHTDITMDDRIVKTGVLTAKYNNLTPRFTVSYKASPEQMFYATAAKGAKAGGFNGKVSGSVTLLPGERSYGEEENWTYEIGNKGALLANRLSYSVSLFYIDWSKRQIGAPPSNYVAPISTVQGQVVPGIIISAGAATSYGIELSTNYRASPNFDFNGSFSWQHATASKGAINPSASTACDNIVCAKNGDVSGNFLGNVPWLQGAVGFEYHRPITSSLTMFAGADEVYRGKLYVDPTNTASIAPYALTNARIGVQSDQWKAFFWVRNAFDHTYAEASFVVPSILQYNVNLGDKRTWGGTLTFNF